MSNELVIPVEQRISQGLEVFETKKKELSELEAEQAKFREAQAKIQSENDHIAKEQREKQAEIDRQQKEIQDKKEAAEREERERLLRIEEERLNKEKEALRIEAEKLATIEAENKRIADEKEAQEAARIEQERQAALAPDKDKLIAWSDALSKVAVPAMSNEATEKIMTDALGLVAKIQQFIAKQTKAL